MAVEVKSNNFSGQTANVTLYAATGTTIPFSAATTINVGTQTMPFTYSSATISNEYGTFSCEFPGLSNKICTTSQLTPPDGDGNRYRTIKIGNQVWMSESLRTTKFQDETTLLDNLNNEPVDNFTWSEANNTSSNKYWAYVNGISGNTQIQGLLYNQYAVTGSTQGAAASISLCPADWHIPTLSEANTFIANAGSNAALIYPGDAYWPAPVGNNTSGFNSLASGMRGFDGNYAAFRIQNFFWTTSNPSSIRIEINGTPTVSTLEERYGFSVRCIKD
jgi:uncharacterized protein (TIGR02145 family)